MQFIIDNLEIFKDKLLLLSMSEFRPISFTTSIYKIIAKDIS